VSTGVFLLLGLIAGYVALRLFKSAGKTVVLDFGLSVIGAMIAGSLFNHSARTAAGVDVASGLVAALTGAVVLLAACHIMLGDTRYGPYAPGGADLNSSSRE
jgi:uncharacterized membrane protein YeaQ/YmgE (transglycosylase-associated protein family)